MKRTLLAIAALTAALWAQNQARKLPGEDWVSLFNGKDLAGWVNVGNEKWDVWADLKQVLTRLDLPIPGR